MLVATKDRRWAVRSVESTAGWSDHKRAALTAAKWGLSTDRDWAMLMVVQLAVNLAGQKAPCWAERSVHRWAVETEAHWAARLAIGWAVHWAVLSAKVTDCCWAVWLELYSVCYSVQ